MPRGCWLVEGILRIKLLRPERDKLSKCQAELGLNAELGHQMWIILLFGFQSVGHINAWTTDMGYYQNWI